LIEYEADNGRVSTLKTYHPLAFNLLMPLNTDIPSKYGSVDVDWMFRVAPVSIHPGTGFFVYGAAKTIWNTGKGVAGWFVKDPMLKFNYGSIFQGGNRRAAWVAHKWLTSGDTLEEVFAPALEFLQDHCTDESICSLPYDDDN